MIAPSSQASLSSATSNSGHLGHGTGSVSTGLDGAKLWPVNSTTPSPKGFSGFEQHSGHGGHLHQPSLPGHHSSGTAGAPSNANVSGQPGTGVTIKTSPMIRDFVQSVDDREWQASLFGLLQNQTYNQCEVDLFELMCKVLDQNLFSQVDWARNSVFFKDLKVGHVFYSLRTKEIDTNIKFLPMLTKRSAISYIIS
jgi:nuclear receptor subfamily 5 group A protein 3